MEQSLDIRRRRLPRVGLEERGRSTCLLKEEGGFLDLGFGDDPTVHDPGAIFLRRQLRCCRDAPCNGCLILGNCLLLRGLRGGQQEEDAADENHFQAVSIVMRKN